jgi:hypothetical protein
MTVVIFNLAVIRALGLGFTASASIMRSEAPLRGLSLISFSDAVASRMKLGEVLSLVRLIGL